MKIPFFALLALIASLSILVSMPSASAQSLECPSCVQILPNEIELYKKLFPITAWTDSQIYNHDSIVKISGYLRPENAIAPILVVVTNPIGNVVTIDQISPTSNGDFSFNLNTQSPLWKQDGDYIIKVQSGSDNRQFKTKFTLMSYDVGDVSNCTVKEIPVTADNGGFYCIPFHSSKGTTINVEGTLELASKSLSLKIRGNDVDSIIVDIPRYLLDSKNSSGMDSDFILLSDGKLIGFEELESDDTTRHIKIDYSPTRRGIYEIIGTHVVPEFGSIAMMILIASITSILVLSRPFSNRFVKF